MSQFYTITLPLPPKELSPNGSHGGWKKQHYAKKRYKHLAAENTTIAFLRAGDNVEPKSWLAATVRATFYFKNRRRRDKDNFNAMLKPAWDGLVDAGLLADDDQLTHLPTVFELDKDNPRVELRVERNEP